MENYKEFFEQNLELLSEELDLFEDENDIWKISGSINNTCGNLAMHLCGNLKHYIGFAIGKTDYKRNRDLEFSIKGLSRNEIKNEINSTADTILPILDKLSQDDLTKKYEYNFFGDDENIGYVLMRLAAHFSYHLGQINYFRRLQK
jgi:hypothetical protein